MDLKFEMVEGLGGKGRKRTKKWRWGAGPGGNHGGGGGADWWGQRAACFLSRAFFFLIVSYMKTIFMYYSFSHRWSMEVGPDLYICKVQDT